jgi:hypothetical protein
MSNHVLRRSVIGMICILAATISAQKSGKGADAKPQESCQPPGKYRYQALEDDHKTPGFSGLAKGTILEAYSTGVAVKGGGVTISDPKCTTSGANCTMIRIGLPAGAQYVGASVWAKNQDRVEWSPCPPHPAGFMDCARYIGYVRFLGSYPQLTTTSTGVEVQWEMINWATYPRDGMLVVDYFMP